MTAHEDFEDAELDELPEEPDEDDEPEEMDRAPQPGNTPAPDEVPPYMRENE